MDKKKDEQFPVELALGVSTIIKAEIDGLIFIPTNTQLVVCPSSDQEDLFKLLDKSLAKLYEKLSYTPITAIGHNFSYLLDKNESFLKDINFEQIDIKNTYKNLGLKGVESTLLQQSLRIDEDIDVILNISYKSISGKRILRLNYHYQADNIKKIIVHSINNFLNNFQHSKKVSKQLIRS